jgi:hypothetical protein
VHLSVLTLVYHLLLPKGVGRAFVALRSSLLVSRAMVAQGRLVMAHCRRGSFQRGGWISDGWPCNKEGALVLEWENAGPCIRVSPADAKKVLVMNMYKQPINTHKQPINIYKQHETTH